MNKHAITSVTTPTFRRHRRKIPSRCRPFVVLNGFRDFVWRRLTGLGEEQKGGEDGQRNDDGPVGDDPTNLEPITIRWATDASSAKSAPKKVPFDARVKKRPVMPGWVVGKVNPFQFCRRSFILIVNPDPGNTALNRHETFRRVFTGRNHRNVSDVLQCRHPPRRTQARQHQRKHPNLPPPIPKKLFHDSRSLICNEFSRFLLSQFAGLREKKVGGECGQGQNEAPIRDDPKRMRRICALNCDDLKPS